MAEAPAPKSVNDSSLSEAESIRAATEAQLAEIEREVKDEPLISALLPISALAVEFQADEIYLNKVHELGGKYHRIRKLRRDGNCFYRAFGFAYLEYLLSSKKECQRFKEICERRKNDLIKLGYTDFTVNDFFDQFVAVVDRAIESCPISELEENFNDQGVSDYLVVFMRLLVSGYLQNEHEFFQNFIDSGATVKDFCCTEVEPMGRESDHIHIIALTQAVEMGLRVEYLDRGLHGVNSHTFPETATPLLTLLYRPGHYDILYGAEGTSN